MVGAAGLEPAQPCGRGILSALRLPVSPRPRGLASYRLRKPRVECQSGDSLPCEPSAISAMGSGMCNAAAMARNSSISAT